MKGFTGYLFVFIICCSCFEKDDLVAPHKTGDLTVGTVEMTAYYKYQVFFDLETNASVSRNLITDWDIGFECSDSGWHVILNTSKMMSAGNTLNSDFNAVTGEEGLEMIFDPSHQTLDSTAIGQWYSITSDVPDSYQHTYLIDRGTDENGLPAGRKKAVFNIQEGSYQIRFADPDGKNEKTASVEKDGTRNFVCYSFDRGLMDIEPDKESWDLLFTRYSTMLESDGQPYPYLVTGVLLNPCNVTATAGTLYAFDEITIRYAEECLLVSQRDIIGYDWKTYDFSQERYTVDAGKIYLIKDGAGYYYKLRFIDFYNPTGQKGYPAFEFVRL